MTHLADLYETMLLIRRFEEEVMTLADQGEIPGVTHPSTGHEAIAVGVTSRRTPDEWVVGYYRCHAHALACGSPPSALIREMLNREGAICGGWSGSMQFCDPEHRFLLGSSIVGSQLSIAAGVAFQEMAAGTGRGVIVFCGDGALGAGVAYESIMIARQKNLPLVFVCEDNGWQDHTLSETVMPLKPAQLLRGLGLDVVEIDGNDVEAVAEASETALSACRSGLGPRAIVARTYLRDFHSQLRSFTPREYRPLEEVNDWHARDPISSVASRVSRSGTDIVPLQERVERFIRRAVMDALDAPPIPPDAREFSQFVSPTTA